MKMPYNSFDSKGIHMALLHCQTHYFHLPFLPKFAELKLEETLLKWIKKSNVQG